VWGAPVLFMKTSEFGSWTAIQISPTSRDHFTKAGRVWRSFSPIFLMILIALANGGCAEVVKNQLSSSPSPLQVLTVSLPKGKVQTTYQASLAVTGGTVPYSWSIASGQLSSGLSLDSATGTISGIPTEVGNSSFKVQIKDSSNSPQTAIQTLAITVDSISSGLEISKTSLPKVRIQSPYQASLSATGGTTPYSWSLSSGLLPAGLSLSSTGTISGIATTAGSRSFEVTVTDANAIATTGNFTISVTGISILSLLTNGLNLGFIQQPYSLVFAAAGGTAPYTWKLVSGQLPSGVTLNSDGQLTGIPTQAGQYSVSFQVSDTTGALASKSFTLQVVSQQFDQYGGSVKVQCSSATGYFHVEKITNRWWFCTPDGNGFWMEGLFDLGPDDHVTNLGTTYDAIAMAKYGDLSMTWGPQQVRRIKSWGFNSVAEFTDGWTWPTWTCTSSSCPAEWVNNGGKQPVPVPMTAQVLPSTYSLINLNNYAPDPVKDTMYGVNLNYYKGYVSVFPDFYDSNFDAWLNGDLANDPTVKPLENSPWVIAWISDECDELNGLCGSGPDLATNPPGQQQRNQALMALIMSPIQVANAGFSLVRNVEIYSNSTVFLKSQLQIYLSTAYGSIGALNTAWGSTYTTFGSTGTQISGESIATGNGSTSSFSKNLANASVSPYTVAVKVNGVIVGADCPQWISVKPCSDVPAGQGSFTGLASASPAISTSTTGIINYSTGAVTINFQTPPARGAAITVDYIHDGWGSGTGLLDEDGRHSWIPSDPVNLGTNVNFNADMSGFLRAMATQYFSVTSTRIKQYAPSNLFLGPGVLGTWSGVADKNVLEAAAPYVDGIATTIDYTRTQAELSYIATHLGDKPMIIWHGAHANADSALWRYANHVDTPCNPCNTQKDRAQFYTGAVNSFLNTTNTVYNDYTIVGFRWWGYLDSWAEKENWGLVSLQDNPYDGVSAVVAPGTDPWGYPTGGEEKNYGNFLDDVRTANLQWLSIP
jgi:hypothetical protein